MKTTDFSSLPEVAQKSIRSAMIANTINNYGRETVINQENGSARKEVAFLDLKKYTPKILENFIELESGCELWIENETYPMRFCLNDEKSKTIHRFKRLIPTLTQTLSGWKKIISVPYLWFNAGKYVDFIWYGMQDVYYKNPKYYSQPVRELYRLFKESKFDYKVCDIICAILEFDTSYRYRFQDIFAEINKEELKRNFFKESGRVIDIMFDREPSLTNGLGKFKKIIPLINLYLRFNNKLRLKIQDFILMANVEEIKLSKEDIYWTNANNEEQDYMYRGVNSKERYQEYLKEKHGIDSLR